MFFPVTRGETSRGGILIQGIVLQYNGKEEVGARAWDDLGQNEFFAHPNPNSTAANSPPDLPILSLFFLPLCSPTDSTGKNKKTKKQRGLLEWRNRK